MIFIPTEVEIMPSPQAEQVEAPAGEVVPAAHAVHEEAFAPEYVFAGHFWQVPAVEEKVPAPQSAQPV